MIIYPNPAWEFSQIYIKPEKIPVTVVIYNELGQKVLIRHPLDNSFNTIGLEPGVYTVELIFELNRVLRRLVII